MSVNFLQEYFVLIFLKILLSHVAVDIKENSSVLPSYSQVQLQLLDPHNKVRGRLELQAVHGNLSC